ncbi:FAD-dependent oxidoreductase [Thermodesulfobacteriota bacterium]
MKYDCSDIGVLGAGIMGCCLALELSKRGYKIDLIDLAPRPMTSTSLNNEGKLHLGFVYANDPVGETHKLMLRGSLAFSSIMERLTGRRAENLGISRPFNYFLPVDSQMGMAAINKHFKEVEKEIKNVCSSSSNLYLDLKIDHYFEQNPPADHKKLFASDLTLGSFRTEERSVSTIAVANILCEAIDNDPNISFFGSTKVLSANRLTSDDVEIELHCNGNTYKTIYPCVANCLWDDKLRVDGTAGITDEGPWLLRYKATINISLKSPENIYVPSATGILGPYGDVVNHNGNSFYISWYPLCKLVQSMDEDGRNLYNFVHKRPLSNFVTLVKSTYPSAARLLASFTHKKFIKKNIYEMSAYIPSLTGLLKSKGKFILGGGVILARGATDIDDPGSYLHQRSRVGPIAYGSYVTIDTGKYCTAPLFAIEAADMIGDILN